MSPPAAKRQLESQECFLARIAQAWRLAERSGRPALLILFSGLASEADMRARFIGSLTATMRECDVLGWFKSDETLGVICLELGKSNPTDAQQAILSRIQDRVFSACSVTASDIRVEVYVLPPFTDRGVLEEADAEAAENLWRMIFQRNQTDVIQSYLDFYGALLIMAALLPLLLVIAICIRMTSRGPALFRQNRVGVGCRVFGLYKFRTMYVANDTGQHQDYMKQFIGGTAEQQLDAHGQPIYKLTNDPRITPIGRFLRRTSLDELPQLWNVLRGEMSLVGPRHTLPYEVECYDLWHRKRVFEVKPGLTGLWQVRGRNRCNFDEMIRLDLHHAQPNSLGLYLQVLRETPGAVIRGHGAC